MDNMVIGICGFGYSGSGAIVDYLMEISRLRRIPKMEFNIAFMADGLLDLEYHLCRQHSRFFDSDMAIFRFKDRMAGLAIRRIPDSHMRKSFMERVNQYLDSLIQVRWQGHSEMWQYHTPKARDPRSDQLLFRVRRKLARKLYQPLPEQIDREMYLSINPDGFLEKTKDFISDVLELLSGETEEGSFLLDQPFPANDPMSVFHFFINPKAIVVQRDPRDMYVLIKHVLKRKLFLPSDHVEDFVRYLQILLNDFANCRRDADKVLEIRFEDMVYEYESTTRRINGFLGLGPVEPTREFFDPQISCVNTRLFERYPEDAQAISYIEEHLGEYLYPYDKYPVMESDAQPF